MSRSALVVFSLLLGCSAVSSSAQSPLVYPDASQAEIDGRVAVGFWASRGGELLDPDRFTAHLVDEHHLEDELAFAAGQWFQPPPGRYRTWVEGEDLVSPSFALLQYAGSPFRGRGFAGVMEVVPSGEVVLHSGLELDETGSVRLLGFGAPSRGEGRDRGFMRSIIRERAGQPVRMPLGRGIGLLYDRRKDRYLAASLPFDVRSGATAIVLPEVRESASDLFVVLKRPEPIGRAGGDDLSLVLSDADRRRRPPDVMVPAWEWVYALWYGVEGRTARLESISEKVFLEAPEIVLGGAGVTTHRGELGLRPSLDVRIELPEEIGPVSQALEILAMDGRVLAHRELPPGAVETRVEGLPPADLYVTLTAYADPGWTWGQRADLRDGASREIVFRPEPIFIRGTLYHGDKPAVGQVRIATDQMRQPRSWLVAETDDEGRYEAMLHAPGLFITYVRLSDTRQPDFKVHSTRIRHDDVIDIRIPATTAIVRVEDSETQGPVDGALVIYDNHFEVEDRDRDVNISMNARTGEDGTAPLAPPRPGRLIVWVEKEGYLRSAGIEREVVDSEEELEIRVRLDPVKDTSPLRLRLPGGGPASGAEVRAQYLGWNEPPVWEGRADGDGLVDVPARAETGWLLIRHPGAGAWVRAWAPEGQENSQWTLPSPAGPLTLRSVDPSGKVVAWKSLAIKIGGAWVAGNSLAWLTGSHVAATNAGGVWTASVLPADEILVMAGSHETVRQALQGFSDGSALRLRFPWPSEPVEVRAALP